MTSVLICENKTKQLLFNMARLNVVTAVVDNCAKNTQLHIGQLTAFENARALFPMWDVGNGVCVCLRMFALLAQTKDPGRL